MAFLPKLPSLRAGDHNGDILKLRPLGFLRFSDRQQEVLDGQEGALDVVCVHLHRSEQSEQASRLRTVADLIPETLLNLPDRWMRTFVSNASVGYQDIQR